jgi:hypothetical protein
MPTTYVCTMYNCSVGKMTEGKSPGVVVYYIVIVYAGSNTARVHIRGQGFYTLKLCLHKTTYLTLLSKFCSALSKMRL